jgi:endonuclease/exonuclease/phosphatase family metal-dependent hydrolase
MKGEFRVATYNVHKCRGLDFRVSPQRIADVLAEVDADVIALQEVVANGSGRREDDQARYIAEELGLDFSLGENRLHRGASYGNVVMTRFEVERARNFDISVPGRERRGCLLTDVKTRSSRGLHVYNIHLGTAMRERRSQVDRLLDHEILSREHGYPRILLGDFNDWMKGMASRLLRSHFHSAEPGGHIPHRRTFPSFLPVMALDHIYYDSHLRVENVFLHRSRTALVASDHLPLVADFSFR